MTQKKKIFFLFFLFPFLLSAQAGRGVYRFLDLPTSSRLAALGGSNVSLYDSDLNTAFSNPALLSKQAKNMLGLNYANYLTDVNFGSAIYGGVINDKNYFSVGIQFINYGRFLAKTETGENPGGGATEEYFQANDLGIYLSYARPITPDFTLGATLKPIFSIYERYLSSALALDLGLNYTNREQHFSAGLVLRNMGFQLKSYYSDKEGQHREKMPFDIRLGLTKGFSHAPIRASLTLHNLQTWSFEHQRKEEKVSLAGEKTTKRPSFLDTAFRHVIMGIEFLPTEYLYLAIGYDHRRRQELKIEGFKSLAGFSFGGGITVYKFNVGFAMTQFQRGVNSFQFSISTSLERFGL